MKQVFFKKMTGRGFFIDHVLFTTILSVSFIYSIGSNMAAYFSGYYRSLDFLGFDVIISILCPILFLCIIIIQVLRCVAVQKETKVLLISLTFLISCIIIYFSTTQFIQPSFVFCTKGLQSFFLQNKQ